MDDIDLFSISLFYYPGAAMPLAAPEKLLKAPVLAKAGAWIPQLHFARLQTHRRNRW